MRIFLCVIFIFVSSMVISSGRADSVRSPLKVSGYVSMNRNGMAPIPSFSLGKPAIIAGFTLRKNRFSYDPQLSYSTEFKPWIIDNWLHYRLIQNKNFELRTGISSSAFFSGIETSEGKIWQCQRYGTLELAGIFTLSGKSTLSMLAWYDKGFDKGTITGYIINLIADKPDILIGRKLIAGINAQFFYLDYTQENDGLFLSPKIALNVKDIPFSIYFQCTQALVSNISPYPGFRWNAGAAFHFGTTGQ
ncbi:MAG TPA: hypothetical protein VI583_12470 [Cyclobacteriaceae bacterium]|nr:hypothetical protein [Cyclobacteriaceae bacterium]